MYRVTRAILSIENYFWQKLLYSTHRRIDTTAMFSNGYPVSQKSALLSELKYFKGETNPHILKDFFESNGYLWIKNFYSRRDVQALKKHCFSTLDLPRHNWLISPRYQSKIRQNTLILQQSEAYLKFTESPMLIEFIERVFGFTPQILKRKLIRVKLPHCPISTGAHYDYNYVRNSSDIVYTIWLPIGDIPANGGGITYLDKSKKITENLEQQLREELVDRQQISEIDIFGFPFDRYGWLTKKIASLAKTYRSKWLMGNFEAGDFVIHDPSIIHASFNNSHPSKEINISTDIRFQSSFSKPDSKWQFPWRSFDELTRKQISKPR